MTLLIERAPALRAAGVTSLQLGDVRVSFAAAGGELEAAAPAPAGKGANLEESAEHPDPLEDPATFGGAVPRFPKPDEGDEDA